MLLIEHGMKHGMIEHGMVKHGMMKHGMGCCTKASEALHGDEAPPSSQEHGKKNSSQKLMLQLWVMER